MSQVFNTIGIVKGKDKSKSSIKFTNNLQKRLNIFKPFTDYDRLDFVEIGKPMNKVQALEFMLAHTNFQNMEDQTLIKNRLNHYKKIINKNDYKVSLSKNPISSMTADQLLEAIK